MTTPESLARIRACFEELIDLPPEERTRRAEGADLDPAQREELVSLLTAGRSQSLTGVRGYDVAAALDDVELRSLRDCSPEGFELERVIGRGGMGVVFRARQLDPPRDVALKLLSVRSGGGEEATRTASREAAVLARLRHPAVAQVIAGGTLHQGAGLLRPWYALELVEGAREIVRHADEERLDRRARLHLLKTVCEAIQHGHEKGVLHGDLKPANVLVDGEGRVKVIDFGVARLLGDELEQASGPVGGTPHYMAPELRAPQARADVRSDVYALGAIMGELFASSADREIRWVSAKAMAPTPEARYPSVAILADELERLARGRPVLAGPGGFVYPAGKFARRHARHLLAIGFTLALASFGAINATRIEAAERELEAAQARASEEASRAFWLLRDATLAVSVPFERGRSPEARARSLLALLASEGSELGAPASHESDRQMLAGFGLHALGDLDAAQLALLRAADGYTALGVRNDPRLYYANLRLAEVELERSQPVAAEEAARAALHALAPMSRQGRERALPAALLARALIAQGAHEDAERLADEVLELGAEGEPGRIDLSLARLWARATRGLEPDVRARVEVLLAAAQRIPGVRVADELAVQQLAAGALVAGGELDAARATLERALTRASRELRETHPRRSALEASLLALGGAPLCADDPAIEAARAEIEDRLSRFDALVRARDSAALAAAEPDLEALAAEARTLLGPQDPLTDQVVLIWSRGLLAAERPDEALELLEGLRGAPARHTGMGYFTSGLFERVLSGTLLRLGRPEQALPVAEEGLRKARLQLPDESRMVRQIAGLVEEARRRAED